ncbi:MAG TPA: DUF378 domain-containing protein [Firmicutes bacterium]|nr:DUF378 domain-containing protein [Bacillota bacterium]
MEIIKKIALILTIIGALNWGLIGLFNINLVTAIIKNALINNILYIIIGIASIICVAYLFDNEKVLED